MSQGPALELWRVEKSYGLLHPKPALRGVSLRVERGECFGLAGANGAGKTTLIRILLGLMAPDEGEARLLGRRPEDPEVRRRVGFVPESAELPPTASPRALVRRWARLRGLEPAGAMEQGLGRLERLGMSALLDRAAGKLSKGERQRTLLALALLGEPELLVLDEPTDGLDPLGRALMREVIREECAAGRTVFLNSHLLSETERICTRVGILHRGRLVREERLGGPRGVDGPATTALVLAQRLGAEAMERAGVRAAPAGATPLRELWPAGELVLVAHDDLAGLNGALDRVRAEGAQLVEVRRVRADLEAALAQVASTPREEPEVEAGAEPASEEPAGPADGAPAPAPLPPLRPRPLRALRATVRVAQEIAADLAAQRIGWLALAAALFATGLILKVAQAELVQGAVAAAQHLGRAASADANRFILSLVARIFFWCSLVGGALLAAVFAPPLLDPRRTVLLLGQPISRGDFALGVVGALCSLAFATSLFFHGLLLGGLRWLEVAASWRFLLAPLPWLAAFAAIALAQLAATFVWRNGILAGLVGLGLILSTSLLGTGSAGRPGAAEGVEGLAYAILPRTVELSKQAGRAAEGAWPSAWAAVPTLAIAAALLLVLHVVARRSER